MGLRGPKPWEPTDDEVAKVRLYAGLGSTQEQIAALIGKSVDTLARNGRTAEALHSGRAETIAKVAGTLVRKALNGDTTSMIFYLKTQAGWSEKQLLDHSSSDGTMRPTLTFDPKKLSSEAIRELMAALNETDPG